MDEKFVFLDSDYDEDDCTQEAIIDPTNDGRKPIWDSANANDDIITCIGSLRIRYADKEILTDPPETMLGTGTIIKIDTQNRCYILTAAHNACQPLRVCLACTKKTIKTKCEKCKCKTLKSNPMQLIKPTSIEFIRRCIVQNHCKSGIQSKFGDPERVYEINECFIPQSLYSLWSSPMAGYDIAIMIFQCKNNEIQLYKSICSHIELKSDQTFGSNKNRLFLYGYPGDKYYITQGNLKQFQMYGMSTGMNGNKFKLDIHSKSKKKYIVNTEIDTQSGMSGSVLWSYGKNINEYIIYGIHTGGNVANLNKGRKFGVNYGTFLDEENLNWIQTIFNMIILKSSLTNEQSSIFEAVIHNFNTQIKHNCDQLKNQQKEIVQLKNENTKIMIQLSAESKEKQVEENSNDGKKSYWSESLNTMLTHGKHNMYAMLATPSLKWNSGNYKHIFTSNDVWIMGKHYTFYHNNKNNSFLTGNIKTSIALDIQSKIWITYRNKFEKILSSSYTSDAGWGCMLRTAQMITAQALIILNYDYGWTLNKLSLNNSNNYYSILQLFNDKHDKNKNPLSIHNMLSYGSVLYNKPVGHWYGPMQSCIMIKKCIENNIELNNKIEVIVSDSQIIYKSDISLKKYALIFLPLRCCGCSWSTYHFNALSNVFNPGNKILINMKIHKFNFYSNSYDIVENVNNLSNNVCIITGCNTGIGKETAKQLYKKGCIIVMACRNLEKANRARNDIIQEINNNNCNEQNLIIIRLDLGDLKTIDEFVDKFNQNQIVNGKLNYLINNAGIMALPTFSVTSQGYEKQFGVNHLSHFYLTQLLLPMIQKSKTRIINVSSLAHRQTSYDCYNSFLNKALKNNNGPAKEDYASWINYGISKTSNILFSRELQRRYGKDGVIAVSLMPGAIMGTELSRNVKFNGMSTVVLMLNMFNIKFIFDNMKSVSEGAATTLRCVSMNDDEIKGGHYYHNCRSGRDFGKLEGAAKMSLSMEYSDYEKESIEGRLWTLSEQLIVQKGFKLTL
eukprot:479345_1